MKEYWMMDKRKLLRSYIEKVLDTYGYIFGGVTSELILKQVNNHNKFAYTGWTMDEVMKEEFLKTFKQIQVEFEGVFRQLFGGGKAALRDDLSRNGKRVCICDPLSQCEASFLCDGERSESGRNGKL